MRNTGYNRNKKQQQVSEKRGKISFYTFEISLKSFQAVFSALKIPLISIYIVNWLQFKRIFYAEKTDEKISEIFQRCKKKICRVFQKITRTR